MNFDPKKLREALTIAFKTTSRNAVLPIIENVLLIVNEKIVTIHATDLYTWIMIYYEDEAATREEQLNSFVVNRAVLPIIKGAKSVKFENINKGLTVTTDKTTFTMPTDNADDFPAYDTGEYKKIFT
jgi:DNA polymerase III sliding clamp (beta) subunit (PCNA family)